MRQWKYRDKIPYVVLGIVTLLLCFFVCGENGVFGSNVDWISQHSVLPEYFRQQFYDTGQFFPEFAANIGGGQNIYHFSYYGLYSPVILFSYFLPFVEMGDYLMAASAAGLAASVVLFYRWLLGRGISRETGFLTALMFLLSGPMIFHSYNQIMFVNYMPFLCLVFIGVDHYFERRKAGLYTIGVFLMIMTSFYFSIGGILVLVLYGVFRYLEIADRKGKTVRLSGFFVDGIRFLMPVFTAVLMSAVFLVPTALALGGTRATKENVNLISLLLPDVQVLRFVYTPYGIGLTTLILSVLMTGLTYKKHYEKILHIGCIVILTVPLFAYLLNGGLYIRDKVMIPFLPLLCYLIAYYLEKQRKKEIPVLEGVLPFLVTLLFLYAGHEQAEYSKYWVLVLIDGVIMVCAVLIVYWKRCVRILAAFPILFLCLYGAALHAGSDRILDREFYDGVTDENTRKAVQETLEDETGFYRAEQQGTSAENAANLNRILGMNQYVSSVYSSIYNSAYQAFRTDTFQTEQPFRNILMQSEAKNPVFQRLMGIKYIFSENDVAGYEKVETSGKIGIYENDEVLPIAYATDRIIRKEDYDKLEFPYNQTALLEGVAAKDGGNVSVEELTQMMPVDIQIPEQSEEKAVVEKTEQGYHIRTKQIENVSIDIGDVSGADTLFLQFDVKNKKKSKDVSIWLEGVKNKLTAKTHIYYNENTTFTYAVNLEEGQTEVEFGFGIGNYEILNLRCYAGNISGRTEELCKSEFQVDKEETKGNRIVGNIEVKNDGYFVTSIPYDENFEVKVNGKTVDYEKVNTAFLGMKIEKGNYDIEIIYHAPGLRMGKVISLIGAVLLILLLMCGKSLDKRLFIG